MNAFEYGSPPDASDRSAAARRRQRSDAEGSPVIHSAPMVLPVAHPPLREGAIAVRDGVVVAIGRRSELRAAYGSAEERRWPGVLTPGLVNAHTHLEYTDFASLGRQRFARFENWSNAFDRRHAAYDGSWLASARRGLEACWATGTARVADVVTDESVVEAWSAGELPGRAYIELLGYDATSWGTSDSTWLEQRIDKLDGTFEVGISPHAPYTLGTRALRDIFAVARRRGVRLHPHLAEPAAENELTQTGTGPLAELVTELDIDLELLRTGGAGRTSAQYVDDLGGLSARTHVAHGVFLDAGDRALLRCRGTAVALCPRSNRAVGTGPPPVAALLAERSPIAVGTDSLASSPSLDLIEDVRVLRDLAREQGYRGDDLERRLVEAATVGGARAAGLDQPRPAGVLRSGSRADFAVFDVDAASAGDPYRAVVDGGGGRCVATAVDGVLVHDRAAWQGG